MNRPDALRRTLFCSLLLVAPVLRAEAGALRIVAPAEGAVVPLLNETQKAFLDLPREERVAAFTNEAFRRELKERGGDRPLPVRLEWEGDAPGGVGSVFSVELRRLPDGTPVFRADTTEHAVEADNLEIARDYAWSVHARGTGVASAEGTFRTEDRAPRLIRAGGVPNVRDLGGRVGLGGRRVRQGLVYRSAGLNDNARDVFYTREELLEREGPALPGRGAALMDGLARVLALRDRPGDLRLLSGDALAGDATVFRPALDAFDAEGAAALRALREVPDSFLGAPAEPARRDEAGDFSFGEGDRRRATGPAVFMVAADFPEDGWVPLSCGADWCWTLFVNGEVAFDRVDGNDRYPISAGNFPFAVPVRKGRNLFAAVVHAGNAGWRWCCRPAPDEPAATLLSTLADNLLYRFDRLFRAKKAREPGASRVDDAHLPLWLDTLGIRTDLDLRKPAERHGMTGSPLGPEVRWIPVSSAQYAGMQEPFGREAFAEVFRVFLDPANYPVVFHCISGQDRTGAVAFILGALLGVDEEELYRDWEATAFHNPGTGFNHRDRFDKLVRGFDRWPGDTIHRRVEAYVLSLGFTPADLGTLRDLLLEPAADDRP